MDRPDGRGSSARANIDFTPNYSDSASGDRFDNAYQPGAPFRRLEADMGLPTGYLSIHEGQSTKNYPGSGRAERSAPAPYYPEQESRTNSRPGTIPSLRDRRQNCVDPGGNYYPRQNNYPGNAYQQSWWEQSQIPPDPNQRFHPSGNPTGDAYKQMWWNRAQQPPYYEQRYPNRNPEPHQIGEMQAEQFAQAINSLVGHSVAEFDPAVPARLGCARAVSLALERAYGLPIRAQGCDALEQEISRYGWMPVNPDQMQPGDVIVAHRLPGDYGHSAIYLGNNQVSNNSSSSGRIQIDGVSKFRSNQYVSVNVFRKMR